MCGRCCFGISTWRKGNRPVQPWWQVPRHVRGIPFTDIVFHRLTRNSAQPPLVTLLEIRRYAPYLIESNMQIFIDGGIRRGTDVLKALALGATAVGLGRPFLFSLAAGYGADGTRRAIQILRQEIEMNMVFLGVTKLSELGPHLVNSMRLERDVVGSVKL